ncbi:cortexin-2 isoform X1 [Microcebus murinus]|uniref:cortexin-2 isoform X1 n=1 Tax=Microcebus murinus TaxID=30608 RepID=UPI003F6A6B7D
MHNSSAHKCFAPPRRGNPGTFSCKHTRARTRTSGGRPRPLSLTDQAQTLTRVGQGSANRRPETPRRCPERASHVVPGTGQPTQTNLPALKSTRWISSPWQQAWKKK